MKISYNGLTVEVDEKEITETTLKAIVDRVIKEGRELSSTQACSEGSIMCACKGGQFVISGESIKDYITNAPTPYK